MKDYILELPEPIKFIKCLNLVNYTKPELDRFRELCNFTEDELDYFNMRSKGKSNVYIFMTMCISESKLYDIKRKVESKINRALMYI